MTFADLVDVGLVLVFVIVRHVSRAPDEGPLAPQRAAWEALSKMEAT